MDANRLWDFTALDLRRLYLARELSPVEVTQAILERVDRFNPLLNAIVTTTPDEAMQRARRAEQCYMTGEGDGALLGVPFTLKDLSATRGIRTTRGSLLWKDWVPDFDALYVERSYQAGGVLIGKTNTPEFGWKGDSGNRVVGPTHNPWKPGRTAGGSSGGAAAAVAAGLGPVAQGTDGAGSVRIPAAFCGVFGMKPSFGRIPYVPPSAIQSLAHIGPLSRTVRDGALFLSVLAGFDHRDPASLDSSNLDFVGACDGGVGGLRVAWSRDLHGAPIDDDVASLAERAALVFQDLGCNVESIRPRWEDPFPILDTIWSSSLAAAFHDTFDDVRAQLDPGLARQIERGQQRTADDIDAAALRHAEFAARALEALQPYDLLLTPTTATAAFTAGDDHPETVGGQPVDAMSWTAFTFPFNLTGQPAATVPCGFTTDGLPVGLQIIGKPGDDATVLRAAAAFEEANPWIQSAPLDDESSIRRGVPVPAG